MTTKIQAAVIAAAVAGEDKLVAYRAAGGKAKTDDAARVHIHRIVNKPDVLALLAEQPHSAEKRLEAAVATRDEALMRLTGVMRGMDDRNAMTAIKQLAELQGWEAPKQLDVAASSHERTLESFYSKEAMFEHLYGGGPTTEQTKIIDEALDKHY